MILLFLPHKFIPMPLLKREFLTLMARPMFLSKCLACKSYLSRWALLFAVRILKLVKHCSRPLLLQDFAIGSSVWLVGTVPIFLVIAMVKFLMTPDHSAPKKFQRAVF